MAELTDEQIMLSVKGGNLPELRELFERYHVKLYNFFLKLTFDKHVSEDLTQNLFYKVIRYRHTFYPVNGSFKSWVYQMARNTHIDHCRQKRKMDDGFVSVDDYGENIHGNPNSFNEDDFERLDNALLQLNTDQREIIVLSRYQGLKYEEISKIKNLSVPAIKVQVHRAIKHLRSFYFNQQ